VFQCGWAVWMNHETEERGALRFDHLRTEQTLNYDQCDHFSAPGPGTFPFFGNTASKSVSKMLVNGTTCGEQGPEKNWLSLRRTAGACGYGAAVKFQTRGWDALVRKSRLLEARREIASKTDATVRNFSRKPENRQTLRRTVY
jgi:hypothetical protein